MCSDILTKNGILDKLNNIHILNDVETNSLALYIADIFKKLQLATFTNIEKHISYKKFENRINIFLRLINRPRYNIYELYVNLAINITKEFTLDNLCFNAVLYDIYNFRFNDPKTFSEDKNPLQDLYCIIKMFVELD